MAESLAIEYPEQHPKCFLHMPKCGGISVHDALVAALPEGSVGNDRGDASAAIAGELRPEVRAAMAAGRLKVAGRDLDAATRSAVVSGHFYLQTLLRIAPPESIATVVREPRTRVLSLYTFWRLTPGYESWHPQTPHEYAMRPLDEFLSEPLMAPAVDNLMCRILLSGPCGHDLIPAADFIAPEHVESVAAEAIQSLDQLGFVGVLESTTAWEGLSRFFGVSLEPNHANATASEQVLTDALPIQQPISERTLDLLHARTAVDQLIYRHAFMAERSEDQVKQASDAAFAAQLVRLGDVGGKSAASLLPLRERLNAVEAELASYRDSLEGIERSVSWRMTSPLRAAKRRMLPRRGRR